MQLITVAQIFSTVLFFFHITLTVQIHNTSTSQKERIGYYTKVTAT